MIITGRGPILQTEDLCRPPVLDPLRGGSAAQIIARLTPEQKTHALIWLGAANLDDLETAIHYVTVRFPAKQAQVSP